jgi:hypothetical protein
MNAGEEAVFAVALEIADPMERAAYLDRACAGNVQLRAAVESLLNAYSAGSFLEVPALKVGEQGTPIASNATEAEHTNGDEESKALYFLTPSHKPDSLGRLEHYEVLEVIGRGGMGIVLRAFDEKLHRVVAIKVMAPELAATSPPRKRFLREARSAAAVRHEHVVDIHAVEAQPIPYLVMEYVSGETLQQRLDRVGPLEVPEILRFGQQIALGLAAAHERGLIHRDIKPSNILLEKGALERVKITDFGLARAVADASLTQSGVIAGTPMYMAPEQTVGDSIDHRADLFSLGSVLYTMCSGRPPFRATTSMATLKRVAEDAPRPIRDIIPEVPEWLCDIVAKLHAKDPAERFQTAKEVADLLGAHLADVQAGRAEGRKAAVESAAPETINRAFAGPGAPKSRPRRWIVAGATLGCLVLLAGAALYFNPFRTRLGTVPLRAEDVLLQLVGTWSIEVETTLPKPDTAKGVVRFDWFPGEKFLRSYTTYDQGTETLTMQRYSGDGTNFKRWYFTSQSALQAIQSGTDGEWDMKTQTMTYRGKLPLWHKVTHVERWVDANHVEITSEIKDHLDAVTLRQTKKMQRIQDMAVGPKALVDPKRPAEFALLDRQVGSWTNTVEATLAELGGKKVQYRTTNEAVPILAHRFVESNEKHELGGRKEYWLLGYDELRSIYRLWHFGGDGEAMEADCAWNPKEKKLTWKSLDGRFNGAWTFTNDDERQASMSAKDANGRLLFEVTGISRRDGIVAANIKELPPAVESVKIGTHPFVVLGGKGVAERKFDTLADAVQGASDGDTIEIRGNGPFVTHPVRIHGRALTVRAAEGFRPVLRLSTEGTAAFANLFETNAPLTLEGLELQIFGATGQGLARAIQSRGAPLFVAHCRFLVKGEAAGISGWSPVFELRHCEMYCSGTRWGRLGWRPKSGNRLLVDNNIFVGGSEILSVRNDDPDLTDATIRLSRNTMVSPICFGWFLGELPRGNGQAQSNAKTFRLHAADNVLDQTSPVFHFIQTPELAARINVLPPAQAAALLPKWFAWSEGTNLYPTTRTFLILGTKAQIWDLAGWESFWKLPKLNALQGRPNYQNADVLSRVRAGIEVGPADFRLTKDSPGKSAGSDGKDLGADVDLVGPGAAYERWKKTPEYQQWLKDTNHVAKAEDAAGKELVKWQGEWENPDQGRLIIKGDRWSWHPAKGSEVVSTIKIVEVTDKMTHVLLLNTGADGKVRTIQVILRLEGNTLHNCGTAGSVRPTEFAQKPGYLYVQWKRVTRPPP